MVVGIWPAARKTVEIYAKTAISITGRYIIMTQINEGVFGGEPISSLRRRSNLHIGKTSEEFDALAAKQRQLLDYLMKHYNIGTEIYNNNFYSDSEQVNSIRAELLDITNQIDDLLEKIDNTFDDLTKS